MFLYKIWIFNIDFSTLLSFVIGMLMGMIILCLIYAVMVILSLRDKKYAVKVQANDLQAKEAEEMVEIARKTFLDKDLRGEASKAEHFSNVSKDLVYGIASRFFPDSKYPLLELTIDECLELIGYIQTRLDEILDKKILSLVKKLKVSDIMKLRKATNSVVDSKAFEVTKEVGKALSISKKILNTINPLTWGRKIVTDVAISLIMRKLYLAVLGIVGEEAYKIYSKSYKNTAEEIDTNIDAIVSEIETDLKNEINKNSEDNQVSTQVVAQDDTNVIRMKQKVYIPKNKPTEYKSEFDGAMPLKKKELRSETLLPLNNDVEIKEE